MNTIFLQTKKECSWNIGLRKGVRSTLLVVVICLIYPAVFGWYANVSAADVIVNVNNKKQEIDGFGASSAWCGKMTQKPLDALFTTLGYSILRVRIDETEPNWQSGTNCAIWNKELSNAKNAIARGAIVFASPWNPPASLRMNTNSSNAKYSIDPSKYAGYRDYLNKYVKDFKDNGVILHAISIQNEPDYAKDWTYWSASQIHDFIVNYGATINTKLMTAESFTFNKSIYDQILNNPKALANVSIFGTHFYGTPVKNYAYPLFESKGRPAGKRLWMTEHFLNRDYDITKTIIPIGKEIHDCMVTGNFNAFVYWWIFHNEGIISERDSTPNKRAYAIAQFAKHIRPGYYRVDATDNPVTNVYVSAYAGSNKVVIVAVNTGTAAVNQKFTIQNATVSQFSNWQTTASTNMAAGSPVNVSANSFTYNLPPQSITTFVGTNASVSVAKPKRTLEQQGFKVVPANNNITIFSVSNIRSYNVSVRTLDGSLVDNENTRKGTFTLPMRTKGTYLVEIESDRHSQVEKVPVF